MRHTCATRASIRRTRRWLATSAWRHQVTTPSVQQQVLVLHRARPGDRSRSVSIGLQKLIDWQNNEQCVDIDRFWFWSVVIYADSPRLTVQCCLHRIIIFLLYMYLYGCLCHSKIVAQFEQVATLLPSHPMASPGFDARGDETRRQVVNWVKWVEGILLAD